MGVSRAMRPRKYLIRRKPSDPKRMTKPPHARSKGRLLLQTDSTRLDCAKHHILPALFAASCRFDLLFREDRTSTGMRTVPERSLRARTVCRTQHAVGYIQDIFTALTRLESVMSPLRPGLVLGRYSCLLEFEDRPVLSSISTV